MRTETYTKNIYTLDEVLNKAIEKNWDINVDYGWWDCSIYTDAEYIGLKITGFDLDRNRCSKGKFTQNPEYVAADIIKNHGNQCDTHKLAVNFLAEYLKLQTWIDRCDNSKFDLFTKTGVYSTYNDKQYELDDLKDQFLKDLLEEYTCILQKEYEYLTSAEAIEETLRCNEYDYDEDGNIV